MTALYRVWVKQMPMSGDLSGFWAFSWDPISSGSTSFYPSYHHFTKFFPCKQNLAKADFPKYLAILTSRLIICPHKKKISFYLAINNVKWWPQLYPVNITLPFHRFSGRIWWSILPQGTSLVHRLMRCMVQARALHSPILVSHELDLRGHQNEGFRQP